MMGGDSPVGRRSSMKSSVWCLYSTTASVSIFNNGRPSLRNPSNRMNNRARKKSVEMNRVHRQTKRNSIGLLPETTIKACLISRIF